MIFANLMRHNFRRRHAVFPALLLILVVGFSATPGILAAQAPARAESAPVTPSEVKPESYHKEVHEAKKEAESEETDEYRHSASVKALAKMMNVDVETAAKTFEYINFAIIALAIGIPLFRILPKTLRNRSEKLSQELETARTATADAKTRLSAVEAKLAGLDSEIAALRKQMEEDMRTDEARSKAQIEEETARIVAAAQQEIAMAGAQAQRSLKQFAGEMAIEGALTRLTVSPETDRALFAEFARDSKAGAARRN